MRTASNLAGTGALKASTRPAGTQARRHPKPVWAALVLIRFVRGYLKYRKTGVTPPEAYVDMRRLFRLTNGRFNDFAAQIARMVHPGRRPGHDLRRGYARVPQGHST